MAAASGPGALDLDFIAIDIQEDEALRALHQTSQQAVSLSKGTSSDIAVGVRWQEFEVTINKQESQSMGLDIDKADGKTMLVMNVKTGPVAEFNRRSEGDKVRVGDRIVIMNGVEGNVRDMLATLAERRQVTCKIRRPVEFRASLAKAISNEKLGIDVDHGSDEHLSVIAIGKVGEGDSVLSKVSFRQTIRVGHPGVVVKVNRGQSDSMKRLANTVDVRFTDETKVADAVPVEWLVKQACSYGPVERYNQKVGPEFDLRVGDLILEVNGLRGTGGKVHDMLKRIALDTKLSFLVTRGEEGALDVAASKAAPEEAGKGDHSASQQPRTTHTTSSAHESEEEK